MLYANNDNKTLILINLQKTPIFNKFNISNYFFLTNNVSLLNNILNFSFFNNCKPIIKNSLNNKQNFIIKKNIYFFYKTINQFRNFFFLKTYIFKTKFRFNKFFSMILYMNSKKKNMKRNFYINYYQLTSFKPNNLTYVKQYNRNWGILTGNAISPFYMDLYSKKKSIRKNLIFSYIKNNFYFNKNNKNLNIFSNNLTNKKILINNYFYLKKLNINYSNLNYITKLNTSFNFKNSYDWFFSKPYIFLNNYKISRVLSTYSNSLVINLYKNYFKFFNSMKKFNFLLKFRNHTDLFFKNFHYNTRLSNKSNNNNLYTVFYSMSNTFSFFSFKNLYLYETFPIIRSKINKNKTKNLWFFRNNIKTKYLKKNKFFFKNFNMNSLKIKSLSYSSVFNGTPSKLSKRLKKYAIWTSVYNFFKFKKIFRLNWQKVSIYFKNTKFCNNIYAKFNVTLTYFWNNSILSKIFIFEFSIFLNTLPFIKNINNNPKISNIINNLNKLFFVSKERNSFVLNRYGFLFITDIFPNLFHKSRFFYNLKKLIYSFSYKNETQKYILKRYIRNNFNVSFYNTNPINNMFNFNNHSANSIFNDFNLTFFDNYMKKNNELLFIFNQNFFQSKNWTYFHNQINSNKNNFNDESNFIIKRVKFKPGYMNLWREVRNTFKSSLMLNFRYQYKLTNYLSKYNKFIKFKTFLFSEMRLINILIRSRILPDHSICYLFIKNNLIYLNGIICCNCNFQIFIGDFIQLIINLKYYILYKWLINLSLKKKNRLKNISKKKSNPSINSDEKKRSNSLPKWILFSKNSIDDVAKFLEVDYFTLSIMILYEPFLWSDLNTYNLIDQRFAVINLYNWKYIT